MTRRHLIGDTCLALVMAISWIITLASTVPRAISGAVGDYGFFTAVADRLRAGEVLYAQIWDNKDPFIFYSIAVARSAGPAGAWALEIFWIVLSTVATFMIARRTRLSSRWAALVAFAAAPLVLVGMPYFMGSTHLPGVALTLVAIALCLSGRFGWAGIPFAMLLFTKFVMWPLALAAVVVISWRLGQGRRLGRFALTTIGVSAVLAFIMAIRGEFFGFLETQVDNILYSQSPIVSAEYTSLFQKVAQHLVILINPHIVVLEVTSAAILVLGLLASRRRTSQGPSSGLPVIWWAALSSFIFAGLTIAITGKWFHHAQIFAVSSLLLLVVLVLALQSLLGGSSPSRNVLTGAVVVLCAYLLAASPPPLHYLDPLRGATAAWQAANTPDRLTEILRQQTPSSIAFIGQGNNLPRSGGLEAWQVVCRHIAQRPFNPQKTFDETVDCLPTATLAVVANDYGRDESFPAYATFFDRVEAILRTDFTCESVQDFRICLRTS